MLMQLYTDVQTVTLRRMSTKNAHVRENKHKNLPPSKSAILLTRPSGTTPSVPAHTTLLTHTSHTGATGSTETMQLLARPRSELLPPQQLQFS